MKKVICLVIDTILTDEQLEESIVNVLCFDKDTDFNDPKQRMHAADGSTGLNHHAGNVRVLYSDERD
jgi:hypothetical protein